MSDLGKTLNQAKDTGELMPYLCSINVQWDRIDLSTVKKARFERADWERFSVKKGDLLVCEGGDIGRAAIWEDETPMLYQNALHRIRFNGSILPRYCLRFLQHLKQAGVLDQTYGKGVTIKHLVKSSLFSIPIPIPPVGEQEQIVVELDCLSEVIAKKKKQLEELDKLAQSIFYDMFGDPITNEKGWETLPIREVAPQTAYKGDIPSRDGKYWLLNLDMVEAQTGTILEEVLFDEKEIGGSTTTFNEDMVLYSKLRPYLNKVVLPMKPGYGTSELVPLLPDKSILNRYFLAYLLRSPSFVAYISLKVAGAKMPRVSLDVFRRFLVLLPPLALQNGFAQKIESIEKQKALIKQSIAETETLFNSRMDYWFN